MDSENSMEILKNVEDFSIDLYKSVASTDRDGIIISPFGAYLVLAMSAYGSDGNTELELKKVLRISDDDSKSLNHFKTLLDNLVNIPDIQLEIASKIFISQGFNIKPEYHSILEKHFDSTCEVIDFSKRTESAEYINEWCREKTKDNIKEIVTKENFTGSTAMLLLSAIYFKADWKDKFSKYSTKPKIFHLDEINSKSLPTMFKERKYIYGELDDVDAKFVELPYESSIKNCKMILIVPNKITGIVEVEKNLEKITCDRISSCGKMETVGLYLPKFKVESSIDLNIHLNKIGISEMFSNSANFGKITNSKLKVSKVIQKACIVVDENGTIASVLTASLKNYVKKQMIPPKILRADRPFMVMIMYKKLPLFYAKFTGECSYEYTL